MRPCARRRPGAALLLVGAAGLALVLLCVEARQAGDIQRAQPRQSGALSEVDAIPDVVECGKSAQERAVGTKSEVQAEPGKPLKFKCADKSHTLGPPAEESGNNEFTKVYKVTKDGKCEEHGSLLTGEVADARLTKSGETPEDQTAVYTFQYDSAQSEEKRLCYTCNEASSPPSSFLKSSPTPACTVLITVPKKEATMPEPEVPGTRPPPSTSDSRAATGAIAAATGAFLAVMFPV